MKKLMFLAILAGIGAYLYAQTSVLDSFRQSAGAPDDMPGQEELAGFPVLDEYGDMLDFGEVLENSSDRIIVLHVCNANRPHCPRKSDIPHFQAVTELERNYPDEIAVIGFNFSGTPADIKRYKSYYGLDYDMLTCPANITATDREEGLRTVKNMKTFYKVISGDNGRAQLPSTFFIKDGKYVVGSVPGMVGYDELEQALDKALYEDES